MLSQISIKDFRNLQEQTLYPSVGINLVLGENGSGKTSLLEAIYLIALGRSFRSRSLKNLVKYDQPSFTIFVKTLEQTPIGFQFNPLTGTQFKLNSVPLKRLSELASYLPLQFIPADCHEFFDNGPKFRRQFLDWGVFHVKHDFNFHWQSHKKALIQRNAAIKKRRQNSEITLWDKQLKAHGDGITECRVEYLQHLLTYFIPVFKYFCNEFQQSIFTLKFNRGWQKDKDYAEMLNENLDRDKSLGYTRSGAHSADWTIRINDLDPKEHLSRGQQKLFYMALCIAQIKLVKQYNEMHKSVLLIDDISSELDANKQRAVIQSLHDLDTQTFISTTESLLINELTEKDKVFHVKHGVIE